MQRLSYATLLVALIASASDAGECQNCGGSRMVGGAAVQVPCPICGGTGAANDQQSKPGGPRPAVCRITAAAGPSQISGSGVLVSKTETSGVVLTNWHVVRSYRNALTVSWPDGTSSPATVVASDEAWDLAALVVPRPAADPVPIAAAAPKLGERLTIAGYGPAGSYLEQSGPVTDYLSPTGKHPRQFVELRAAARQGDSGGPILNSDGQLAGVLFGCRDGLTCGSCSTRLALFLSGVSTVPACRDGRCYKQ